MSQAGKVEQGASSKPLRVGFHGLVQRVRAQLHLYRPPVRNWHFWVVQALVLFIAGVHSTLEFFREVWYPAYLPFDPLHSYLLSFIPVSLLFIPVVYAALNFGFAGAVATAVWCTVLTFPNLVMHQGLERVREISQLGIVDATAIFVGQRVEQEMHARRRAEVAGAALKTSEAKYRALFESSPVAILVLDSDGIVLEANLVAGDLFGRERDVLKGMTMDGLLGAVETRKLLSQDQGYDGRDAHIVYRAKDGAEIYLKPTLTRTNDSQGKSVLQVVLRNVTEEQQRQAGLRSYAAYVLRAQEEERKRIAQELHDDAVQQLVLLCRQLDTIEDAFSPKGGAAAGIREARRSAEKIAAGLRSFAQAIRPPVLDDLGLVPAIQRVLLDAAERMKMKGQLKVNGEERRLHPEAELVLFRVAQEAMRNVERHAQAKNLIVTIAFAERETALKVQDDGVGFTLPRGSGDLAASGRLGLLGMQERAESLGGRLEIRSSPGKGTRVSVSVPAEAPVTETAGRPS